MRERQRGGERERENKRYKGNFKNSDSCKNINTHTAQLTKMLTDTSSTEPKPRDR